MSTTIFIDCETGGLDPDTDALLSVGLALWADGMLRTSTEITVKAEGLRMTPKALTVNRIDVEAHDTGALFRLDAADAVIRAVRSFGCSDLLGGHNVAFDVAFLRRLLGRERYAATFTHRTVDTASIARFLMDAGLMPMGSSSLDACLAHFGLHAGELRHTARGDAEITALLYGRMLDAVRAAVPA